MRYMLIHAGAPGLDDAREQVAGFDVLECAGLDEAIGAAARHPMARAGILEVRPFRRLGED